LQGDLITRGILINDKINAMYLRNDAMIIFYEAINLIGLLLIIKSNDASLRASHFAHNETICWTRYLHSRTIQPKADKISIALRK
jgi:hypothetical protein